jgi:murein DD-endopeptidase MepM/ murein hydrolase activator NlpD
MRDWATWWAVASTLLVGLAAHHPLIAQAWQGQPSGTKTPSAKRARPSPAPVPAATASPALKHTVRPGQTIWSIGREHGVSVEALIRVNRLSPDTKLRVGQQLSLPLSEVPPGSQEPPSLADIVLERPPATPLVEFIRPVPGAVASPFGPRRRAWHGGVDLQAERGAPIRAAAAGMVVTSGWERAYGRVVKIWHFGDLMSVYAHNLENLTKVGDWVEQGQVIATVGSTGRATAPHLHFEIRLNGRKYNPAFWLPEPETLSASAGGLRSPASVP